jgi:hypothetical protein
MKRLLWLLFPLLAGCGSPSEEMSWRLTGSDDAPAGLCAGLAATSHVHLAQIRIAAVVGAEGQLSGTIQHPGIPPETVVEALGSARDDLPLELRRRLGDWRLVLIESGTGREFQVPLQEGQ